MGKVLLKKVELHPSPKDVSPRPEQSATVWVEIEIGGLKPFEWPLHVSPLTTLDDALVKAAEKLRQFGEEIADAADMSFLPLPKERGFFDVGQGGPAVILDEE